MRRKARWLRSSLARRAPCCSATSPARRRWVSSLTLRRCALSWGGTSPWRRWPCSGTVERFVGDAVLAVFGIPEVRADDALRAVRATFDMQRSLPELSEELMGSIGIGLTVRTGMNTGSVVAGSARAGGSSPSWPAEQQLLTAAGDEIDRHLPPEGMSRTPWRRSTLCSCLTSARAVVA